MACERVFLCVCVYAHVRARTFERVLAFPQLYFSSGSCFACASLSTLSLHAADRWFRGALTLILILPLRLSIRLILLFKPLPWEHAPHGAQAGGSGEVGLEQVGGSS